MVWDALASYAKQADDATLLYHVRRIQVRRCGELLTGPTGLEPATPGLFSPVFCVWLRLVRSARVS